MKAHLWEPFIENPKTTTMRRVQETFAAWKSVNDQINALEAALKKHVAAGDTPSPELTSKVGALRVESDRLLLIAQHALLTIKTPRASSGESTWG